MKRSIKAGEWSTLVLPFSMSETIVKEVFGDDVELADLQGYDLNGNGISVNFTTVTDMEANHPYIIKTTKDIAQFKVNSVTIENPNPVYEPATNAKFVGTYVAGTAIPSSALFLSDNKFWYSNGKSISKGFRGYFILDDANLGQSSSRISLVIDGTTAVKTILNDMPDNQTFLYNLQGIRVKAPAKGIYIQNGKKVVIK